MSSGNITTIAGTGTGTYSGDNGAATSATLYRPTMVALDSSGIQYLLFILKINSPACINTLGNVYIADRSNQRIRKVIASSGVIITIAGTGTASFSGDGGPATSATIYTVYGVALDSSGRPSYYIISGMHIIIPS